MKALSEEEFTCFSQVETIGQERYTSFVREKLEGSGSIWENQKRKLLTFINNNNC